MLAEYRQAIADAEVRLERLGEQLADLVPSWSMAPVVAACQAMRGVAFLSAVTFVAEIGDVRRFDSPRQLMAYLGLVPSESSTGERVKTNRRDALTLARLHRAGELTPVWVPDPGHEAMRELVRAREAAMEDLRAKRQHLQSFLLRHGRVFTGRGAWTKAHTRWLCELRFEHPAQHLVLAEYRQAILDAEARLERLTRQVADLVPSWSMAPVIAAYQALRGVAFLSAVTFVAEIGDVRRFDNPRQLMAISAWCRPRARPASGRGAAASPRPATAVPGGCWSRAPGPTASRRG